MQVKELRDILLNLPDAMEIILQKDSEGNGYSPLAGADSNAVYIADCDYSGSVYSLAWTADEACKTDEKWELIKTMPKALILYPIN